MAPFSQCGLMSLGKSLLLSAESSHASYAVLIGRVRGLIYGALE